MPGGGAVSEGSTCMSSLQEVPENVFADGCEGGDISAGDSRVRVALAALLNNVVDD